MIILPTSQAQRGMATHESTQRLENSYSVPQQCALQLRTTEYGHCLLLVQQAISYSRSLNWWHHWSCHTHKHMPTAWLCRTARCVIKEIWEHFTSRDRLQINLKRAPIEWQQAKLYIWLIYMFYAMHIIASIHMQMQTLGVNITRMSLATYILCRYCV